MPPPAPLRPHRLLVFINPFGGKKQARQIFHSLVAPLFELAGISSHVIGKTFSNKLQMDKWLKLHVDWLSTSFSVCFQWLSGQTKPETTSWRKTWQALMGRHFKHSGLKRDRQKRRSHKLKAWCLIWTVWCVWEATACSAKCFMARSGGLSKRPALVRTILVSLCSLARFTLVSSLQVTDVKYLWSGGVWFRDLARTFSWNLCSSCRLHRLRVLRHGGSDRPCYISFTHHHWWERILTILWNTSFVWIHWTSHNTLQVTLNLWMCVQSITALLWCATQCLSLAMASMGMYWSRVKNTAGWDHSDTTIQVWNEQTNKT